MTAANEGHVEIVGLLLSHPEIDANGQDEVRENKFKLVTL